MEKILMHNGRAIRFKSTAALPLRYKAQFGRDLFADLAEIQSCWVGPEIDEEKVRAEIESGNLSEETKTLMSNVHIDAERLDFSLIYNIIWALAKTADNSLLPPIEWFDTFEDGIPAFQWFAQLNELIIASMRGTQKNSQAAADRLQPMG